MAGVIGYTAYTVRPVTRICAIPGLSCANPGSMAGVIGYTAYTVRPNFRSGGPYSLREYGPPGPNSLANTVPRTEFPGCTKPINRTQFPRELSPPPRTVFPGFFLIHACIFHPLHSRKGWHIWFEKQKPMIAGRKLLSSFCNN